MRERGFTEVGLEEGILGCGLETGMAEHPRDRNSERRRGLEGEHRPRISWNKVMGTWDDRLKAGTTVERRTEYWASRPAPTSLKSSSRLCCLRKSIFLTATSLPELRTVAMHTIPVEPSPILMKLSR